MVDGVNETQTTQPNPSKFEAQAQHQAAQQKEAEESVQMSEKIYRGLYESTIALADTTDLNEVISVIAEQARNILSGECSTIYLWDEFERLLNPYYTNAEGDKDKFMEHKLKLGEGLTGWVAKHNQSLRLRDVDDLQELSEYPDLQHKGKHEEYVKQHS